MAQDSPKFKITREGQRFVCPDGQDLLELAEAEDFSVSGVAESLGLTNRQLEYAVERASGLRPKELFRRHRMLLARRLVAEGSPARGSSRERGLSIFPGQPIGPRETPLRA